MLMKSLLVHLGKLQRTWYVSDSTSSGYHFSNYFTILFLDALNLTNCACFFFIQMKDLILIIIIHGNLMKRNASSTFLDDLFSTHSLLFAEIISIIEWT